MWYRFLTNFYVLHTLFCNLLLFWKNFPYFKFGTIRNGNAMNEHPHTHISD